MSSHEAMRQLHPESDGSDRSVQQMASRSLPLAPALLFPNAKIRETVSFLIAGPPR